jgi:hypothetical protein
MKNIVHISTLLLGIIMLLSACSYTMPLRNDFVSTNPRMFQSSSLKEKRIILVIDSYTKDYRLTRPVYNWAGGNTTPDHASFDIGVAFSKEISDMCNSLFFSANEVSSFKRAKEKAGQGVNFIIIPEIINAEIFLPSVRFADIKAEIAVRYSFYTSSGDLIDKGAITGRGEKELVFTRKNYQLAMEAALRDLLQKSYNIFLEVLK